MARTAEGRQLTRLQRQIQLAIKNDSLAELERLWDLVDPTDLRGTYHLFREAAGPAAARWYRQAVEAAEEFYGELRAAETGEEPALAPRVAPEPPDPGGMADHIGAAGLAGIIHSRQQGFPVAAAHRNGRVKVDGVATSLVMSGGRDTTLRLAGRDARATGFRRVTSADPCSFCADLATETLRADPGARFAAHDTCSCTLDIEF